MKKNSLYRYCSSSGLIMLLLAIPIIAGSGCDKEFEGPDKYAKLYVFDFDLKGSSGHQVGTFCEYSVDNDKFSYSIKKTKPNYNGNSLLAPSMVVINDLPSKIEQCGTYQIVINEKGVVTEIKDFVYNGESNVFVGRGENWSMYITREDWNPEVPR